MSIKIIDRYLLRQFIMAFLICFCSLTGLYIVFDAFTNLDAFTAAAEKEGSLLQVMLRFYMFLRGFLLQPDFRRAGADQRHVHFDMDSTSQRNDGPHGGRRVESPCGPPRDCGGHLHQPLHGRGPRVGAAPLSPRTEPISRRLAGRRGAVLKPRYDNKTDILIRGAHTFSGDQRIESPNFLLPPPLSRYGRQLVAEDAFYKPARDGHPSGYLMTQVRQPADLTEKPSLLGPAGEPVILCPMDNDWLKPGECFVISQVDFEQLTGGKGWLQYSRTSDLITGLKNESLDFGADVRVAIHARLVKPLLDVNLLFLGLPLVLARQPQPVLGGRPVPAGGLRVPVVGPRGSLSGTGRLHLAAVGRLAAADGLYARGGRVVRAA